MWFSLRANHTGRLHHTKTVCIRPSRPMRQSAVHSDPSLVHRPILWATRYFKGWIPKVIFLLVVRTSRPLPEVFSALRSAGVHCQVSQLYISYFNPCKSQWLQVGFRADINTSDTNLHVWKKQAFHKHLFSHQTLYKDQHLINTCSLPKIWNYWSSLMKTCYLGKRSVHN